MDVKDGEKMESGEKFKKAVIGGFDKADVMNYFEKMQKKHREETAALKEELALLRQSTSALQTQCSDQSDPIEELTSEQVKNIFTGEATVWSQILGQ